MLTERGAGTRCRRRTGADSDRFAPPPKWVGASQSQVIVALNGRES
jgi:hypothetical protein